MPPVIHTTRCDNCGICYQICPQDVFSFEKGSPPKVVYPKECWYCGGCVIDCPKEAITLKLPLHLHIVPSPALYGPPGPGDEEALRRGAAFSRSIVTDDADSGKGE